MRFSPFLSLFNTVDIKLRFPKMNYLSAGVPTAGKVATADGPPKEPHIPSDPRVAGCSRPD